MRKMDINKIKISLSGLLVGLLMRLVQHSFSNQANFGSQSFLACGPYEDGDTMGGAMGFLGRNNKVDVEKSDYEDDLQSEILFV